jgi:uncharacterized protein YlzI (FlbEa/FlbD family)
MTERFVFLPHRYSPDGYINPRYVVAIKAATEVNECSVVLSNGKSYVVEGSMHDIKDKLSKGD